MASKASGSRLKTDARLRVRLARDAREVEAAYDLAARVFGPSYFEARATKERVLRELEPVGSPAELVLALADGQVAGLIRLVARRLRFGADQFGVAGITSVAVDPAWRAHGVGGRLMRAAMQEGRRRGDDLSLLFARRAVDGWYPRFGFTGIGQHVQCQVTGDLSGLAARPSDLKRLVTGFTPARLPVMRASYAAAYRSVPGSFVRSADWWGRFGARLRLRPGAECLTLLDGRRSPSGYAVIEEDRVLEVGITPRLAPAAAMLLIAEMRRRRHTTPLFLLHPAHPVVRALSAVNHTLSVRKAWDGGHMAAALTPAAAARLRTHGVATGRHRGLVSDPFVWPAWTVLDEF